MPLTQLHNRVKEERDCKITFQPLVKYPFLDGHHSEGPLPENISYGSVAQYSILLSDKYTIRVHNVKRRSSKRDDCIIMSSNKVGLVKNILNRNGDIFIVCTVFEKIVPIYNNPCSSTSVGMYECSNLSSTFELYHADSIKFKACYFPTTDSAFYVCALLHINN